jgi:hypothetical protein
VVTQAAPRDAIAEGGGAFPRGAALDACGLRRNGAGFVDKARRGGRMARRRALRYQGAS